jgi:DNA-binding PadR family transcriptional regulator
MARKRHSSLQTLRVLTLLTLRAEGHGYLLAKETSIPESTIHGILKRLEQDEFVTSYWNVPGVDKPPANHLPQYLQPLEDETDEPPAKRGGARQCFIITREGILFTKKLREQLEQSKQARTRQLKH